jgi:hypothetical protein
MLPQFLEALALTLVLYNLGVAWTMAAVHYPGYRQVPPGQLATYVRAHNARVAPTTTVPAMIAYLSTATLVWIAPQPPGPVFFAATFANFLNVPIVLWSVLQERPIHARLARGSTDVRLLDRLVLGSLIPALAWTAEAGILLWMVIRKV